MPHVWMLPVAIKNGPGSFWHWYGYNNPDDPAPFVEKRYGRGTTPNFGHSLGLLITIGMVLLPLALSILKALSQH